MKHAETFLTWLRKAELAVCFLAFVVMALVLMVDVLNREFTGAGVYGSGQIGVFGMVIVAFLGLGVATAEGAHLRPRFADHLIPARFEGTLNRIADIITALFYGFVAYVAVEAVSISYGFTEVTSTLRILIWPFQSVIVIAFGMGAIRHVIFARYPALRPSDNAAKAVTDPEAAAE